jgi:hypothetical protein
MRDGLMTFNEFVLNEKKYILGVYAITLDMLHGKTKESECIFKGTESDIRK